MRPPTMSELTYFIHLLGVFLRGILLIDGILHWDDG